MEPNEITPNDVIMIDIDGNVVPCTVLYIEDTDIKLLDHGSGRAFWRSLDSLRESKRFNGHVTTYVNYPDWLKQNRPDVEVRFLAPNGKSLKDSIKVPKEPPEEPRFSKKELALLQQMAASGELQRLVKEMKNSEDSECTSS